jgi:hypothetical protein
MTNLLSREIGTAIKEANTTIRQVTTSAPPLSKSNEDQKETYNQSKIPFYQSKSILSTVELSLSEIISVLKYVYNNYEPILLVLL